MFNDILRSMKRLGHALLRLELLHKELTEQSLSTLYRERVERFCSGRFCALVMGDVKKGKSMFINAVLGSEDLAPSSPDVSPTVSFRIRYGQERSCRVFFMPRSGKEPMEVPRDTLADFATQEGNPDNEKGVDFIELTCPSPLLARGIVLIDTPGTGGHFRSAQLQCLRFAPHADAVFFVTDSVDSPIGVEEMARLRLVHELVPNLCFVQTKAGAVDQSDRDSRRKNNLSIISAGLGNCDTDDIPYFVLDSKKKMTADKKGSLQKIQRSGFASLLHFVQGVRRQRKQQMAASVVPALGGDMLKRVGAALDFRRRILEADTDEKRRELSSVLAEAEAALAAQPGDLAARLQSAIHAKVEQLGKDAEKGIRALVEAKKLLAPFAEDLEKAEDLSQLQRIGYEIPASVIGELAIHMQKLQLELESRIRELLETPASFAGASRRKDGATAAALSLPPSLPGDDGTLSDIMPLVSATLCSCIAVIVGMPGRIFDLKLRRQPLVDARAALLRQFESGLAELYKCSAESLQSALRQCENDIRARIESVIMSRRASLKKARLMLQHEARMTPAEREKELELLTRSRVAFDRIQCLIDTSASAPQLA